MAAQKQLTRREKVLAGIVGGIVFLFFNLFFVKFAVQKGGQLRLDLAGKSTDLKTMQILLSERDLWVKRDAWLKKNQPPLQNEGSAEAALFDQMKELAKGNDIVLENPVFGATEKTPAYRAVSISLEAKCSWPALIKFLAVVQQPQQFLVFETVNLTIDSKDASAMRGKFKVARWFAPEQ